MYGYPRQGENRELKKAVEAHWADRSSAEDLLEAARRLRAHRLTELVDAGIGEIPSNDFSLYDHVLDTAVMLGAVPARHLAAVPDASTPAGRRRAVGPARRAGAGHRPAAGRAGGGAPRL